jgi:hypothetical protein
MRTLILLSLAALNAFAAPNFTGAWKLNVQKSNYGTFPAPASVVRTILHDGDSVSMTTLQKGQVGETTTTVKYTLDGKQFTNQTATGETQGIAKWNGSQLVITTSREVNGAEIKSVETWELSGEGKMLTIQTRMSLPKQGEFQVKQVFEKQ